MQKTVLTRAVAVALATLGTGAAFAQSSVTLYGNLDVALDSVHKGQGNVDGSVFALSAATKAATTAKTTLTRVSPSTSSVNAIGVKGVEDIGGGYKGSFVLEGQMSPDTGAQNGPDSRMWGRQAYVGLTTPGGEIRLGRQYAPMFYSYAFTTVEALGGADMQGLGLAANNLQVRQDNQVSYWLKAGDITAAVSYSPQAGVDQKISSGRGQNTSAAASGQIIGGASAGTEAAGQGGRGQTYGALISMAVTPEISANAAFHYNKFGNAQLVSGSATSTPPTLVTLYNLDNAKALSLAAKYTDAAAGLVVSGNLYQTRINMDTAPTLKLSVLGLGVKQTIDQFAVGAQFGYAKFTGGSNGSDTTLMLIGDYNFSKRSKLYVRAGWMKDKKGNLADTETAGVKLTGGPIPLLAGLGSTETPFYAGGGVNIDATTRVVSVGIRHQF